MTRVLVPIAEGSEELEAVTMIDLFRRAEFDVTVAGLAAGPVRASRDTVLVPDAHLEELADQSFDLIALPGGLPGAKRLGDSELLAGLLRRQYDEGRWIAAICAAPQVLARHGLLTGRKATSFPGALDDFDGIERIDEPVVVDGHILTSRGPGTAMDFALELIERCAGREVRDRVEQGLQRPAAHRRR
ncbi:MULTISPECIES: DJ-1 family glyoxalase III [unclassified Wenzhouxiangella]|uniref:DJ-1 family glyoxalase III n=1 Tax=unclassified Wenzhouxiangella TaxID=2613841 RepID=UPI000E32C507|nr:MULTISPECIES: DJ-1 family glyoxalase III [unclassified Wenzhouxiangella]RFF29178.1 DJ-1/PfpI family protein [Wenzhouxiangella sp. 15181]RFP67997.1 DJ-1/PfpI family protein [Wenzhouxiangella sp. 15190]